MNIADPKCRWPPVYDFESLGEEINTLVSTNEIFDIFFHIRNLDSGLYQGDILKYPGLFPFIDNNGNIQVIEENYDYWMILGNTCDLDRELPSPHLSHIIPLMPLDDNIPTSIIRDLRTYNSYKKFFVPMWGESSRKGFVIDFTRSCSVEKECLLNHTETVARLTFKSWLLLHSCLVRYLARNDGRHD
jgi:hypothetical protein